MSAGPNATALLRCVSQNAAGGIESGVTYTAEAANASPLQPLLNAINAPTEALVGRPLIGNGVNGAPGTGANGGAGGILIGTGGAGGAGGNAVLIGNGGNGGNAGIGYIAGTPGAGGSALIGASGMDGLV